MEGKKPEETEEEFIDVISEPSSLEDLGPLEELEVDGPYDTNLEQMPDPFQPAPASYSSEVATSSQQANNVPTSRTTPRLLGTSEIIDTSEILELLDTSNLSAFMEDPPMNPVRRSVDRAQQTDPQQLLQPQQPLQPLQPHHQQQPQHPQQHHRQPQQHHHQPQQHHHQPQQHHHQPQQHHHQPQQHHHQPQQHHHQPQQHHHQPQQQHHQPQQHHHQPQQQHHQPQQQHQTQYHQQPPSLLHTATPPRHISTPPRPAPARAGLVPVHPRPIPTPPRPISAPPRHTSVPPKQLSTPPRPTSTPPRPISQAPLPMPVPPRPTSTLPRPPRPILSPQRAHGSGQSSQSVGAAFYSRHSVPIYLRKLSRRPGVPVTNSFLVGRDVKFVYRPPDKLELDTIMPSPRNVTIPRIVLNSGTSIPLLGYGTNGMSGWLCRQAVRMAIRAGYRLIDTASINGNEEEIGSAIEECIKSDVVKREELSIVVKLWNTSHERNLVRPALEASLKNLKLDYADLFLIHWPMGYNPKGSHPTKPVTKSIGAGGPKGAFVDYTMTHYTETWQGMEDCFLAGKAKAIGLSNFNSEMCDILICMPCRYKPSFLQVEVHPFFQQNNLISYGIQHQIAIGAHTPIGGPRQVPTAENEWPIQDHVLDSPLLARLARKYHKTPAQIVIRWQIQRRVVCFPKSALPLHIYSNIDVFDFKLTSDEIQLISQLNYNRGRLVWLADEEIVSDHPYYPFYFMPVWKPTTRDDTTDGHVSPPLHRPPHVPSDN